MIELFWIGGPFFMVPLLIASIAVLTVAIERIRSFRAATTDYDDFLEEMTSTIASDGISAGVDLADQIPGPVAATWSVGLQSARQPLQIIREKMDSTAIAEIQRLERFLPLVSVVAQVAPLIGILGTVWGMIDAFEGMAGGLATGVGVNGEIIADGIGRALTTTAAGLAVAIPATLLYHWFSHKVDLFIDDIDRSRADLIEILSRLTPRKATRPAARATETAQ
ncbi:MAG: hypothetical protein CBC13_00090 [Planctomycetia bacterium TMED53]|nr:MAG: hypothetical protein CBC13_00090 [Planctomycetia bacterium TMED53]